MPWKRYIYQPTGIFKSSHTQGVKHLIESCKAGGRPVWHATPFILAAKIQMNLITDALMRESIEVSAGAARDIHCYPHYQTYWYHTGCPLTPIPKNPRCLSRMWIRERNGGLNWLTAVQIIDEADIPLILNSNWTPFGTLTDHPQLK